MESQRTLPQPSSPSARGSGAPPERTAARTREPPTHRIIARTPGEANAGPGELVLGRYRLEDRLGAGGFGVVWRAHDELLHREVALKRVPLGPGGDSERAMREALVAARLSHPAIVALYEACAQDGALYLISELVEGETLGRLIAERRLSDEQVLEIGIALAGALSHAHSRGVVHRDIKPQNVLVPRSAEQHHEAAKLTDFGGASLAGEDVLTRTGDILGTLAYMAPEQSEGREVGEEADLYSLALVLYEALCGVNPVRGPTPAATARRIGRRLEPLARRRRDLPRFLTGALDRALLPSPRARAGIEELRLALEETLEHGLVPRRPARRTRTSRRTRADTELASALPPGSSAVPALAAATPTDAAPRSRLPPLRAPQVREPGPEDWLAHADRAVDQLQAHAGGAARPAAPRGTLSRRVWLAGMLALACWQAIAGRPGLSLVILAALTPALLIGAEPGSSRVPAARLVCVLAPVLGFVGLAGAFPAIAGQARGTGERVLRGALGYWWLTLAAPLLATRLWLALPPGTPARESWEGSVGLAATHVIAPALTLGVLLGALLWGAASAALPWIVRGRGPWLDALAAGLWTLVLVLAQPALDGGLLTAPGVHPRGALLGGLVGAAVALAARALRGPVGRRCA